MTEQSIVPTAEPPVVLQAHRRRRHKRLGGRAPTMEVVRSAMPASTIALLVLLPWFAIPGAFTLPLPASALTLLFVIWRQFSGGGPPLRNTGLKHPLRIMLIVMFAYWLFSAAYGWVHLTLIGKTTLHLSTGNVSYLPVALQRVVLMMMCLLAFELTRGQAWSVLRTLYFWLIGASISVVCHVLSQLSGDELVQRAGIFTEGNHAGLYYVLSIFIALEYRRRTTSRAALGFVALMVIGLLLTRSSAGILILVIALWFREFMRARSLLVGIRNALLSLAVIGAIGGAMFASNLDFGIAEKLFGEDLTAASFSRIDRISSIDVALQLFEKFPIIGNGLQSYGFLSNNLLAGPLAAIYDNSYRRIANNIYAEIAAELGSVGLLLLAITLATIVRAVYRSPSDRSCNLLAGTVGMLLYWLAFPSYTLIYLWIFLGLACRDAQPIRSLPGKPTPLSRRPMSRDHVTPTP